MSTASGNDRRRGRRTADRGGTGLAARIVAATAELLDETGDESAVTLRGIARRAGVSAPAIYGHYPDTSSILLVVVQEAFAELASALRSAAGAEREDPREQALARLRAVSAAYLDFAASHPQRYRVMFGGLWTATAAIESGSVDRAEIEALGQDSLAVITAAVEACVRVGASTSTDPFADAVALWLGLHGLAHQRVVTAAFPWPTDIEARIVTALARLTLS